MDDIARVCKALGDERRFSIVQLLLERDYCVRALAHRLRISEAAVSQHLKLLREAGLVEGEKRGYWTHYSVKRDALRNAAGGLLGMAGTSGEEVAGCARERAAGRIAATKREE